MKKRTVKPPSLYEVRLNRVIELHKRLGLTHLDAELLDKLAREKSSKGKGKILGEHYDSLSLNDVR